MAARGKNAGRFKNMPAAQVRRLAEALGYESTPARSELLRRLAGRSDIEARLAGLVASLSRNARELFCVFAGKRVPADAVESGSGLSPDDAREALAELEEKGLAGMRSKGEYEFAAKPTPFPKPSSEPDTTQRFGSRRFLMDLVRLMQLVRQKDLRVLSDGSPGVRFLSKLEAVLRVEGDEGGDERFDAYMNLLYRTALEAGLLELEGKLLRVARGADDFFQMPLHTRVQELFEAWLRCKGINELHLSDRLRLKGKPSPNSNDIPDHNRLCAARRHLADCLSHFPGDRWYPVDGLVSFCRTKAPDMLVKALPDDRAAEMNLVYRGIFARDGSDHHDGLPRAGNWHRVEGEFIRVALWVLSALGVVELDGGGDWFRLTPEGRYCLGLTPEPTCAGLKGKCLVIQPNFEVVVFQQNATPEILHTLGMFADLVAGRESPVYQMNLASIYRSAKEGMNFDEVKDFLEECSTTGVPPNVAATLREWWDRCNTVYYEEYCDVLELPPDRPELAALLANGNGGKVRVDRLLVFPGGMSSPPKAARVLDHRNRTRCAKADPDGLITLDLEEADVFVESNLSGMAKFEGREGNRAFYRLDPAAFAAMNDEEYERALEFIETVCGELPPQAAFRILSSRGVGAEVKVGEIKAVRLSSDTKRLKLEEALFAPYAVGRLGDFWLLPADKWEKVKGHLQELGIRTGKAGKALKEAAKNGGNGSTVRLRQGRREIVELLNRAAERGAFVELVYSLPDGRGRFVVKPIEVITNGGGEVVEAYDPQRGGNVLLTLSNIESVRRLVRRSSKET